MEIFKIVREKICELYSLEVEEVTESTRIVEDIHADSLDLIDLALNIEETFNIVIPDEQLESMSTIGDVVNFIKTAKEKEILKEVSVGQTI